jgi:dihydrofolate synthase/folylpolyglutamate synthase
VKTLVPAAFHQLYQRTAHGIKPGLDIISALLEDLGHPERTFPYVHVAGTNGKGSVCAMVESILRHAGYRTGLYTSPHLVDFNERFKLNGAPASTAELMPILERVVDIESATRPATFFECTTAMAFEWFRRQGVEWGIMETGMGGRWDATNVHVPAVCAITQIGLDHMNYLGGTIEMIAAEKAGIIKSGVPVVIGDLDEEPREVILRQAAMLGAPVVDAMQSVRIERRSMSWAGQKIKIASAECDYRSIQLPLLGDHQIANCAIAVAVVETLAALGRIQLEPEQVEQGLARVQWPGRLQVLSREPVMVLDVAHNPSGARALMKALKRLAGDIPIGMVTGFLEDKDVEGCLRVFQSGATRFWAVSIEAERGLSADQLVGRARSLGVEMRAVSLSGALDEARAWALQEGGMVCIAGSLYLAGMVLRDRS